MYRELKDVKPKDKPRSNETAKPVINPVIPATIPFLTPSINLPKPNAKPIQPNKPNEETSDFEFDPQRFGGQKLPEGNYNLTVRRQVQNRHIEGTTEYNNYIEENNKKRKSFLPSVLAPNVNVQDLINEFHGKGIFAPHPDGKQLRERVDTGRIIGQYWDYEEGKLVDTTWLMIVYSNKGTHVYPIYPFEEM